MHGKKKDVAVIILAAGLGTRMKSDKAKVLHKILDKPMIIHVVQPAISIAGENVIVIIGHQAEIVKKTVTKTANVSFALQEEQLGTGHAVMCGLPHLSEAVEDVIILCGDVPLLTVDSIKALIDKHREENNECTVLAVEMEKPTGYGRMVVDKKGDVTRIVEEKDASADEKKISIINSGIYCVKKAFLKLAISEIKADNAQNEYYLTDIIEVGHREKKKLGMMVGNDPEEIIGVNSIMDLKAAENLMKVRIGKTT